MVSPELGDYLDLIVAMVREHGPVSRKQIDELLLDKLPEVMTEKQKRSKIHNLLGELSAGKRIRNVGSRGHPQWQVVGESESQNYGGQVFHLELTKLWGAGLSS